MLFLYCVFCGAASVKKLFRLIGDVAMEILVPKDMTKYCTTFPSVPTGEITRESWVSNLRNMFSKERRVILVEGNESSGKTILLSQFARTYSDRTFSFFIGPDFLTSSKTKFLIEMCEQMKYFSMVNDLGALSEVNIEELGEYDLKELYTKFLHRLSRAVRQGKGPFYFVIDGINHIKRLDNNNDDLLSYIPSSPGEGIYVLMSTTLGQTYPPPLAEGYTWLIGLFSKLEAEKFLSEFLTKQQIMKVYEICDGMPGYLSEVRRQLESGLSSEDVLNNLEPSYYGLLEKQWNRLILSDIDEKIIAVLALGPELYDEKMITEILNIELDKVQDCLKIVKFLRKNSISKFLEFETGYKKFAIKKVEDYKPVIIQKLIEYYEKGGVKSLLHLPTLYKSDNRFESMVQLVRNKPLMQVLGHDKRISLVRRNLRIVSDMAHEKKDWLRLSWSALAEAIFTRLVTSPLGMESQISALLALGRLAEATQLSYACILPEDRLKAISLVCEHYKKYHLDIPEAISVSLEDAVNLFDSTVELTVNIREKILDVCADIFPIRADLAISLLERIAKDTGRDKYDGKLMDLLMTNLLLRLGSEGDTAQTVHTQIKDDSLRNFVLAAPSTISGIPAKDVLKQVEEIKDGSAKLFLLQSWCNTNSKNEEAYVVIECALSLMIESEGYSPTQLHLRQFAEPLKNCTDHEIVRRLINQIDMLKGTGLKHPMEENARLELILAIIEYKWSQETAKKRLDVVLNMLEIGIDLDDQCYIIARILLHLPDILPSDAELYTQLHLRLIDSYYSLIDTSAEQLRLTKRLIAAVASYDYLLATDFAEALNTEDRRNSAIAEVLQVYTKNDPKTLDFEYIKNTLYKISYIPYRDWVLVHIIKRFSMYEGSDIEESIKLYFLELVKEIESPAGRAIGCCHYLNWLTNGNTEIQEEITRILKYSIEHIDPLWSKISIGFDIVTFLAPKNQSLATDMFNKVVCYRGESTFSDKRISELYIEACKTMIRLIPDLVKLKDCREKIDSIIEVIKKIPSIVDQCELLSQLALKCANSVPRDMIEDIAKICVNVLDRSNDRDSTNSALVHVAPLLFECKPMELMERIEGLSDSLRDILLNNVAYYVLTKRPQSEVVGLKYFGTVDYYDAKIVCDSVLPKMKTDIGIYDVISNIVHMMLEDGKEGKKRHIFSERQSLTIARKMVEIVSNQLPDARNIKHNGYVLACQTLFAKLRDASVISNFRNKTEWDKLCPKWVDLLRDIEALSNIADRTLVLSLAGRNAYPNEKNIGDLALQKAQNCLELIDNKVDRAHRYEEVAEVCNDCSNKQVTEYLVHEAMKYAKCCSAAEGRDQLMGRIVELAHSIDPALSTTIASRIDEPSRRAHLEDNLRVLSLHSDPTRIEQYQNEECKRVLEPAFRKILNSLCSDRGTTQREEVIGKWLYKALGQDYDTINLAVFWLLENNIRVNKHLKTSQLGDFLVEVNELLDLIILVGEAVTQIQTGAMQVAASYSVQTNMRLFLAGQKDEAMDCIKAWLMENVQDNLVIYDPYFSENEIGILKCVPQQTRVTILKAAYLKEWEGMTERFSTEWRKVCDQAPPDTSIYVFMNSNRQTPLHDRFFLASDAGLKLGTSFNGLGSKDASVDILDQDKTTQALQQFVEPLVLRSPKSHNGHDLIRRVFNLE